LLSPDGDSEELTDPEDIMTFLSQLWKVRIWSGKYSLKKSTPLWREKANTFLCDNLLKDLKVLIEPQPTEDGAGTDPINIEEVKQALAVINENPHFNSELLEDKFDGDQETYSILLTEEGRRVFMKAKEMIAKDDVKT